LQHISISIVLIIDFMAEGVLFGGEAGKLFGGSV